MKRGLALAFILLISLSLVTAQLEKLEEGRDNLEQTQDKIKELRDDDSEFLRTQWEEILKDNTYLGPFLEWYERAEPVINPTSKFIFGMEPAFSFLFLLVIMIWVLILNFIYRAISLASILDKKWVQILISLGIVIIGSNFGITKGIADLTASGIALLGVWYIQLIAVIVGWGIVIAIWNLEKIISIWKKQSKEEVAKIKEEANRKVLQTYADTISDAN